MITCLLQDLGQLLLQILFPLLTLFSLGGVRSETKKKKKKDLKIIRDRKLLLCTLSLEDMLKETTLIFNKWQDVPLQGYMCTTEIRAIIYPEELKWTYHLQFHIWNTSTLLQLKRHQHIHRSTDISNSLKAATLRTFKEVRDT